MIEERYSVNLNVHEIGHEAEAREIYRRLTDLAFEIQIEVGASASVIVNKWETGESQ